MRTARNAGDSRGIDAIHDELQRIEEAFDSIVQDESAYIDYLYMEKYNAVIGMINELVEKYEMKVIIMCNTDILGARYVDNIFRGKLDCITYNKIATNKSLHEVVDKTFCEIVLDNNDFKSKLKDLMDKTIVDFENVWRAYGNRNLRFVSAFVSSFIQTATLFQDTQMEEEFLDSLFYSMFIVEVSFNEKCIGCLRKFPTGSNLRFYLQVYNSSDEMEELILKSKVKDYIKWIDIHFSGMFLLNTITPDAESIATEKEDYKTYKYYELERVLVKENDKMQELDIVRSLEETSAFRAKMSEAEKSAIEEIAKFEAFKIEHILYMKKNISVEIRFDDYLEKIDFDDEECSSKIQAVENALSRVERIVSNRSRTDIFNEIYELLYSKYDVDKVDDSFEGYNMFVQSKIAQSEKMIRRRC